jgi:hypothetical protein
MEDLEAFGVSRHLLKKWTKAIPYFFLEGGKGSFFPPFALFLTP